MTPLDVPEPAEPPERPELPAGEVHVWQAPMVGPDGAAALPPDEIARAERLRFPEARRRFVRSRALLRSILGRHAPERERRALDAGAGTGANLRLLRELEYRDVTGVDLSEDALRYCREKGLGPVSRADLCSLPFGGIKTSGLGRRHSDEGLRMFTWPQAVFVHEWPADQPELWWFPYTPLKNKIVSWLTKLA